MKPKTEELLWVLLWACDIFSQPTSRHLTDSFESWAYGNGFLRQIQRLERQEWIESTTTPAGDRVYRLSRTGQVHALGGHEPVKRWDRPWDGTWRLALFDVPESHSANRNKLRRYLQSRGFGYLQNSVWITPDPVNRERALVADGPVDVESLVFLEARPCAGETDADIVAGAWDFGAINRAYERNREVLARRPKRPLDCESAAARFHQWLREERKSWQAVMRLDPLLPKALLPSNYGGRPAWNRRQEVMAEAGKQMRLFQIH